MIEKTGPSYGQFLRSHHPPKVNGRKGYERYRGCLRLEFAFTCAYCLSTEREVSRGAAFGGFEVEHFRPKGVARFDRQRNHYFNLLWACRACNGTKGKRWPTKAMEVRGERLLDPSAEDLGKHLTVKGLVVEPVSDSPAGKTTIRLLNLNSSLHRNRRKEREERAIQLALVEGNIARLEAEALRFPTDSTARLEALEVTKGLARDLRRDTPPWDAPSECAWPPSPCGTRKSRGMASRPPTQAAACEPMPSTPTP